MAEFKVWVSDTALEDQGDSGTWVRMLLLKSLAEWYEFGDYHIEEVDV